MFCFAFNTLGTFLTNYDVTRVKIRIADFKVTLSFGTKTNFYKRKPTNGDY